MKQKGFTLLELMITVAIVAILAAIAYASYQDQIVKSRRSAGAACLAQSAQFMERYYTTNLSYVGAQALQCDTDVAAHYSIAFAADPTARAYVLEATPQGAQATADTKCGTLSINQRGERGKTGTASVDDCW